MADPLPPSYDQAITGDFSAPPPPSSSPTPPESSPPPASSPLLSSEPFTETEDLHLNGEETRHFSTTDPDVDTNRSPRCGGRSKKFSWWIPPVILTAVGIPIVIHFDLLPEPYIVQKAKYANQLTNANCRTEPPRKDHLGVKWSHCPKNYQGNYDNGTKCKFECQDGLFMHVYDYWGYPNNKGEVTPAHYTCLEAEWVYSMAQYNRLFQCLPKSDPAEDCELKELEKEISGKSKPPTVEDCPRNYRPGHYYFTGTKCTVRCPRTYSLYVQSSANKLEKGPKSVEFTCQNSTWVSSLNGEYKIKECFRSSLAGLDCETTVGVPLKDCLQNEKGNYFLGTKCNLECRENYTLHAYGNMENFDEKPVLELMNTKVEATCTSSTFYSKSKHSMWTFSLADGSSKLKYERVPKNPDRMFYCPINDRVYSEGTLCIWQCKTGYVVYNKRLKTKRLPNIISSFHYTCEDSRWTTSISRKFRNGFLYCVKRNVTQF